MSAELKHLITIEETPLEICQSLLKTAQNTLKKGYHRYPRLNDLKKLTVVNAFFEDSTRTRVSFELAAMRLGGQVINLPVAQSAMNKGETIKDTIATIAAMGCQLFVIRHREDRILEQLSHQIDSPVSFINAGSGRYAHPSQALLDLLTITQHKKNLSDLSIAIIGDIKHSRVVSSQLALYKKFGIKDIRLIAPKTWIPEQLSDHYSITDNLDKGIEGCDVINTLRIQKERILESEQMDLAWYRQHFQLNHDHLSHAKPDAIILHPGPMNRDIEIASVVADGPQSRIQNQVTNGVAIRMAILSFLAKHYV